MALLVVNVHTAVLAQVAKTCAVGILHAAAPVGVMVTLEHVFVTMKTRGQRVPPVATACRVLGVTNRAIGRPHAARAAAVVAIRNANVWRNGQESIVMSAL